MTAFARIGTKHRPEPTRQDAPAPAVRAVRVETRAEPVTVSRVTYLPAVDAKTIDYAETIRSILPEDAAAAVTWERPDKLRDDVREIRAWLDSFEAALQSRGRHGKAG